jgi:hypothetical protein
MQTRPRVFVRSLMVLTVVGLGSSPAFAQDMPTEPAEAGAAADAKAAKKQAAKDAAEGQKLLKKKSFAEAVPKLEAAYAADPKPATLRALAEAQGGAGRPIEAYRSYETLLQAHADALAPRERDAVDVSMALLAQLTGTLRLSVSETDVRVNVDGRDVSAAEAARSLRLMPGRHAVAIARPDFELYTTAVEVEGGKETALDVKLKAEVKTGHVRVTAPDVSDGSVLVDDKEVGRLPWEGDLPPGPHVIDVKGAGVLSNPKTVDVVAKSDVAVELPPRPMPPPVVATPLAPPAGVPPAEPSVVAAAPLPSPEPTPAVTATPDFVRAPREPDGVRVGVLLGLLSLPRPVEAELSIKVGRYLAFGAQYSLLPDLTPPGFDADLKLNAAQGIVRFFPFGGGFYLGGGFGYQQFRASLGSTNPSSGDRLEVSCDMSGPFVTPQLGWLWVWKSGFAFGINLGAQIPLPKDPIVVATYNGVPVPDQPSGAVPQEVIDDANGMKDSVRTIAKFVAKYPVPTIDLLKIGLFF